MKYNKILRMYRLNFTVGEKEIEINNRTNHKNPCAQQIMSYKDLIWNSSTD